MKLLVGNTGLVGQTIKQSETFDYEFNSKNLYTFEHLAKDGDELFLTCLPATKWLVNKNLTADIQNINNIISVISKFHYSKITLISTIDVYNDSPASLHTHEDYYPNVSKLSYGNNRYMFELMVREMVKYDDLKIFRLPALFNSLIKKNVLYDLIHNNNVDQINQNSYYQWYNLDNLYDDIKIYSEKYPDETVFNLFTEPIYTADIVKLFPHYIDKVKNGDFIMYNYKTKFGNYYISDKHTVLNEIKQFINEFSIK
jgi:hypothetical protein